MKAFKTNTFKHEIEFKYNLKNIVEKINLKRWKAKENSKFRKLDLIK